MREAKLAGLPQVLGQLLATADKRAAELGVPDTEAGLSPELLDL